MKLLLTLSEGYSILMQSDLNRFFIENNKLRQVIGSKFFGTFVSLVFILEFLLYKYDSLSFVYDCWAARELTANYSFGFIKRAFLGTICDFIARAEDIDYGQATLILFYIEEVFFTFVLLGILLYLINRFKDPNLNMAILLLLSTNMIGFYYNDWAEPDVTMMALTLIACYLVAKDRLLWIIPFLMGICMLIHEAYVMMYFGTVMVLLFIRFARGKGRRRYRYLSVLLLSGVICTGLFIHLYFFTTKAFTITPQEFIDHSIEMYGIPWSHPEYGSMLNDLLYAFWGMSKPMYAMWVNGHPTYDFWIRMVVVGLALLTCCSLIIVKARIYNNVIKFEPDRLVKLGYLMGAFLFLLTIPLIMVQTDEGRWFYAVIFQDFFVLIFLYLTGDERIVESMHKNVRCNLINLFIVALNACVFFNPSIQFISRIFSPVIGQ